MIKTIIGAQVSASLVGNYFHNLINHFYKILPMWENGEETLDVYMQGLQAELIGCKNFIPEMQENSLYLSLLSILQYLIDSPSCPIKEVRREVFGAISICNKLSFAYSKPEEPVGEENTEGKE